MQIEHYHALPLGHQLGHYVIEKVLGASGFGITYLAEDINLQKKVAIKEFLPDELVIRTGDLTVSPKTSAEAENFQYGLQRFLDEARTLAIFNHPNIVKVHNFLEANGTAYFVMEYEEGETLEALLLRRDDKMNEDEVLTIILPVLDGLREVHAHNFLHRDIKPGNIFIRENGTPMLIDFGAARYSVGYKSKSITQILTPGYAPVEQYSTDLKKQGAFTDLYGVGAVMYRMLAGTVPVEAQDRSNALIDGDPDPYRPMKELAEGGDTNLHSAIDWALNLRAADRPRDAKAFQEVLIGEKEIQSGSYDKTVKVDAHKHQTGASAKAVEEERSSTLMFAGVGIAIAVIMFGAWWFVFKKPVVEINANVPVEVFSKKGELLGITPLKKALVKDQTYQFTLKKKGYETQSKGWVAERDGQLYIEMLKHPMLQITSNVEADVYMDERLIGQAPVKQELRRGNEYSITLKKEGYTTVSRKYTASIDDAVHLKLDKYPIVTIKSNVSTASVYLDGSYKGTTPLELQLKKKISYSLKLKKSGYRDLSKRFSLNGDRDIELAMQKIPSKPKYQSSSSRSSSNYPMPSKSEVRSAIYDDVKSDARRWSFTRFNGGVSVSSIKRSGNTLYVEGSFGYSGFLSQGSRYYEAEIRIDSDGDLFVTRNCWRIETGTWCT